MGFGGIIFASLSCLLMVLMISNVFHQDNTKETVPNFF